MAYDDSGPPSGFRVGRRADAVTPDRVVVADSLGCVLLSATARALGGVRHDPQPVPAPYAGIHPYASGQDEALARELVRRALDCDAADDLDAEAIAAWAVEHYRGPRRHAGETPRPIPAVVVGSPHGAAAHLAAALRAPWLPTGFEFSARWPGGRVADPCRALEHGIAVASRVRAVNPHLAVRQVHDPVVRGRAAGTTVAFVAQWRRLPWAYREFVATHLAAGAPILLVRDARRWPVFDLDDGLTFQLGSPVAGLEPEDYLGGGPDLRYAVRQAGGDPLRWRAPDGTPLDGLAEHAPERAFEEDLSALAGQVGWPLHRVRYPRPAALSVAVAEVLRGWLAAGGGGDALAVECGRTLDPAQTLRCGLVPYWCESALRTEVTEAELWLAGSRRFASIDVLVEPPGRPSSVIAPIAQWRAVAWFGARRGAVDRTALRGYPYGRLPGRHATLLLGGRPCAEQPAPLTPGDAVTGLAQAGAPAGLHMG